MQKIGWNSQRGVGLIEVLVAVVITAFAVLGLARLHIAALRYQKVANTRSLASQYASNIADRMRANVTGALTYVTNDTYPQEVSAPAVSCNIRACSSEEIANLDVYEWRTQLKTGMPGGWGKIMGDMTSGFKVFIYFHEATKEDTEDSGCPEVLPDPKVRCFVTEFLP